MLVTHCKFPVSVSYQMVFSTLRQKHSSDHGGPRCLDSGCTDAWHLASCFRVEIAWLVRATTWHHIHGGSCQPPAAFVLLCFALFQVI